MINLLNLNKLILIITIFLISIYNFANAANEPAELWKDEEKQNTENLENKEELKKKSIIFIDDKEDVEILIDAEDIKSENEVVGLFDPEENNFTLNMWIPSDGKEIKKTIARINKLKLSKFSENLFFQVLFTNAYPPQKNLTADKFLDIKINWLIKNERVNDLENLLKTNSLVGQKSKAIKYLVDEYLSSANISSACDKIKFVDRNVQNNYLEKFKIYCLIYEDRKNEAQLMFDLLKEKGFEEKFFENKINYLLGISEQTNQKIQDNNLFDFYLSQITSKNFDYKPNDKTNKYIWRYLTSANLIQIENYDDEETILTYERAAASGSYEKKQIFKIYKNILFNVNQLVNAQEIYKTLPSYKARALIYQKILLVDNVEKKLNFAFLLKELFDVDKLTDVYLEELMNILKNIDKNDIPESYAELVEKYSKDKFQNNKNIKFNNDVIHKSKILKYFLDNDYNIKKIEKDIKNVYKKIKKNKKYYISIKDITVLESLRDDGVTLPDTLNLDDLVSKLTVPQGLEDLTRDNQTGLIMLKMVEIIGEDNVEDLDPETIYFLTKILNKLRLKKIRNKILISNFATKA